MFFLDPCGNALEFKGLDDLERVLEVKEHGGTDLIQ
jgi:extradiol dioxygenase family protein